MKQVVMASAAAWIAYLLLSLTGCERPAHAPARGARSTDLMADVRQVRS